MRTKFYILPTILATIIFITFSSCSKDNDSDGGQALGKEGITMKVDGAQWKSTTTTMITKQNDEEDEDDDHIVLISAVRGNDEGESESITMFISIPANKFNNPKGTYAIAFDEDESNRFWSTLTKISDTGDSKIYMSVDPADEENAIGSLEITGFELGNQQSINEIGYTKLSGNFQLELFPFTEAGDKLKITEGTFNLSSGINFGF